MSNDRHAGVMDASYAEGRQKKPHLEFRYKVRAKVAVDAFKDRGVRGGKDVRVLDLGAAEGLTLREMVRLLNTDGACLGVEYSDELLASAPQMPGNLKLVKGDVMDLGELVEDGAYDLVTCLAVLEHLPDPDAALRQAMRALKPGGVFVATCPNPVWDDIADKLKLVAGDHHEQELDKDGMIGLCDRAGFAGVEFRPFMFAPIGFLPYLRVPVDIGRSLKIDRWIEKAGLLDFSFVNQAVVAIKPRG